MSKGLSSVDIVSIVWFVVFFVLLLVSGILTLNWLTKWQKKFSRKFKDLSDMNKCPETSQYFNDFQAEFPQWAIAITASAITAAVFLALLVTMKYGGMIQCGYGAITLLTLIVLIATFIAIYKTQNCILGRMCGHKACIDPYFKPSTPPSEST